MNDHAVTLKQLRALVAVVDCGSVVAAAGRLNVTPPAVSVQLRTLEENVGSQVLTRPGLEPNPIGAELVDATRRIEAMLSRAFERTVALREGRAGRVALGVTSTGKYFAPGLIARINEAMPELDLSLAVGNRSEIIAALAEGRLDLAITGRPPRQHAFDATVLGEHPHVWIAAPTHRLIGTAGLTPDDLRSETILTREVGSGTRSLMERVMNVEGDGLPDHRMEFGSNETIKQAVMAGLGVALISGHTVVAELESGRLALLDVAGAPIVRRWFVTHPADAEHSGAVRRLLDFVVSLDGAFLPRCRTGWSAR